MPRQINLGGIKIGIGASTLELQKGLSQAQKQLKKFGRSMERTGAVLSKSFTLPLVAIGGAAALAARDFEKANATIRRGTGATGKQLEDLNKSFKTVFAGSDESAAEVSSVIADLNTRTGATGKTLERLANTVLDLSDVAGADLNQTVANSTRVFGDWSIATDKQVEALDYLFKASQSTGIEMNELMQLIVDYGAPLRALGFDFEQSAALMGKFEKEGVNTKAILGGLKQGLGKLIKEGIDPGKAFQQLINDFKRTGDEAKLTQRALAVFGTRSVVDMAKGIAEGRFEIDGLVTSLKGSKETIHGVAEASKTLDERLGEIKNSFITALAAFGSPILEQIEPVLKGIAAQLQNVADYFTTLSPQTKQFIVLVGGLAASAGPVLVALGAVSAALAALSTPIGVVAVAVAGLGLAFVAFGDDIVNFAKTSIKNIQFWSQSLSQAWAKQREEGNIFVKAIIKIGDVLQLIVTKYVQILKKGFDIIGQLFDALIQKVTEGLTIIADWIPGYHELVRQIAIEQQTLTKEIVLSTKATSDFNRELARADDNREKLRVLRRAMRDGTLSAEEFKRKKRELAAETRKLGTDIKKTGTEIKDFGVDLDALVGTSSKAKDKIKDIEVDVATDIADPLIDAHEKAVTAWRSTFENAITGVTFDFKDALSQVAVGFAAELAAGFSGALGGIDFSSPQDFGGKIGSSLLNAISGSNGDILGALFGSGRPEGVSGPLLPSGGFNPGILSTDPGGLFAGAGGVGGYVTAIAASAEALSQVGQSTSQTVKGLSQGIAAGVGAAFGGPVGAAIGQQIGKFAGRGLSKAFGLSGPTNPETLARIDFTSKLNDLLKSVGGVNIRGSDGPVKLTQFDIFGGDSKFNGGKGFDFLNSLDTQARSTFSSLGLALKEVFELEDLDAAQAGAILSENLLGDLDNARLLVQKLGFDFETLKGKILETALAGEIDWLEFNSAVRDLGEAFEPGLVKMAAVGDAIAQLKNSGARGFEAVKGVRDLAVEAMEAGATRVSELESYLIAAGASTEEAAQLMAAYAGRGIDSLDQVASASDELLGSIAGDLKAAGFGFVELSGEVLKVKDALDQINATTLQAKELKINVKLEGDTDALGEATPNALGGVYGTAQKFARGGVVGSPTFFKYSGGLGLMGEAGPEAILPLRRGRGGRLGVELNGKGGAGGTVNIHIDAHNADTGTEARLYEILSTFEDRIVASAVNTMASMMDRGAL